MTFFPTLQSLGRNVVLFFLTQQIINSLLAFEDITCWINFCDIPLGGLLIFFPPFICGNSYFLIGTASEW